MSTCPECKRETIWRIGGEWCRWCRGFIHEVSLHQFESGEGVVRILHARIKG